MRVSIAGALALAAPLAKPIGGNGEDNDDPDDRLLPERRNAEQIATV